MGKTERMHGINVAKLINLVIYKVKEGKDDEFRKLLKLHWPALNKLGLVKGEPARIWRGNNIRSESQGSSWVELFSWKEENSADVAHQTPEVMQIWEPMGPLLEGMDILYLEPEQL
jgi:hypothetical protein